jgi:hypothetical protein
MPDGANNFRLIWNHVDVAAAARQLDQHPELWNEFPERRIAGSPHEGVDDIWVRWRTRDQLTAPERYTEEHFASFLHPWRTLTEIQPIVYELMARVSAVYLGGILITRIPPGREVLPHHDRGPWHAEFMNCKVYLPLKSNAECVNLCEGDSVVMRAGEAWTFDNLRVHSVENRGDTERVTLIVCMRVED